MAINYEANEWKDGESGGTPITAARLNAMEAGILAACNGVDGFDGTVDLSSGVTGTLPIANGGTGNTTGNAASATRLATARTIRTNLASTSAASFDGTADVTPGVTGTLPVANGGTGATTASAALENLGGIGLRRTAHYAQVGSINTANQYVIVYVEDDNGTIRSLYATDSSFVLYSNNDSKAVWSIPVTSAERGLEAYPVGAVYISYVSTSPASLFGGTWTAITGRFPYFNAGTETGGSASHAHWQTVGKYADEGLYVTDGTLKNSTGSSGGDLSVTRTRASTSGATLALTSFDGSFQSSTVRQDQTYTDSTLPPYQTLYAWRRTA